MNLFDAAPASLCAIPAPDLESPALANALLARFSATLARARFVQHVCTRMTARESEALEHSTHLLRAHAASAWSDAPAPRDFIDARARTALLMTAEACACVPVSAPAPAPAPALGRATPDAACNGTGAIAAESASPRAMSPASAQAPDRPILATRATLSYCHERALVLLKTWYSLSVLATQ